MKKKLLIGATLSIAVAAVIKRVAEKEKQTVTFNFSNKHELDVLLSEAKFYARKFDDSLKELNDFVPNLNQE